MRKKLLSNMTTGALVLALTFFAASCSSDDGNVFDTPNTGGEENPDENEDEDDGVATLVFDEGDPSNDKVVAEAAEKLVAWYPVA